MQDIRALIRERDDFVISGHINPDGDAIGACLGLGLALEKLGKRVKVVLEPFADKYAIIPGKHLLYKGLLSELSPQVFFCMDCGDDSRLGETHELIDRADITVCVDHHMTNTGFARLNYLDCEASSTCEMVFRLLETEVKLDKDIASALYAGLVNDTGGFRYSATSRETLAIAGHLMALGIPFTDIYTELVHQHTFLEVKIFGRALNICERFLDGRVIYACITQALLDEVGATSRDLDGIVEYLLNVRGADISVLLYNRKADEVKVSFRSHAINVGHVASVLGGGGHRLAAGCSLYGDIMEIKDRVLALVEQEMIKHA